MNTQTEAIAKTIVDALELAKVAIQEAEDMLDTLDFEDAVEVEPVVPDHVHLNKRGRKLVDLLARPGGAHIDDIADELCVERESVRSLVSKVTRKIGQRAVCRDGVYTLMP